MHVEAANLLAEALPTLLAIVRFKMLAGLHKYDVTGKIRLICNDMFPGFILIRLKQEKQLACL